MWGCCITAKLALFKMCLFNQQSDRKITKKQKMMNMELIIGHAYDGSCMQMNCMFLGHVDIRFLVNPGYILHIWQHFHVLFLLYLGSTMNEKYYTNHKMAFHIRMSMKCKKRWLRSHLEHPSKYSQYCSFGASLRFDVLTSWMLWHVSAWSMFLIILCLLCISLIKQKIRSMNEWWPNHWDKSLTSSMQSYSIVKLQFLGA